MKLSALLDESSAHVLGFEWLIGAVAPVSPYGERLFSELRPFASGEELQAQTRARTIAELAFSLETDRLETVRAALRDLPDAIAAVARASMGDVLDDPHFLELRRFCATIGRVDELLAGLPRPRISNVAIRAVGAALETGARKGVDFYLDDAFDAQLANARDRLAREQAELDASRGRESERATRELGRDEVAGEQFIVMRDELRGPLPAGIRVVREAPTYLLCALEYGEAAQAALTRRDAAADAVAATEERVRERLSALVREHAAGLDEAARALGELDVLLAAARFTQTHECRPAAVASEPTLAFEQARFLPLETELVAAGRSFVPIDLD
ncbi:MAG: hypothetical protein WB810_09160, partial [Candidatus Cybelea sp.]